LADELANNLTVDDTDNNLARNRVTYYNVPYYHPDEQASGGDPISADDLAEQLADNLTVDDTNEDDTTEDKWLRCDKDGCFYETLYKTNLFNHKKGQNCPAGKCYHEVDVEGTTYYLCVKDKEGGLCSYTTKFKVNLFNHQKGDNCPFVTTFKKDETNNFVCLFEDCDYKTPHLTNIQNHQKGKGCVGKKSEEEREK